MLRSTAGRETSSSPARKEGKARRINLSLRASTIDDARELGLNLSRLADDSIAAAVRAEKLRRWHEDNRAALEYHARRIARHGMFNKDLVSF